jgi:flagellar motor switch protein FliG
MTSASSNLRKAAVLIRSVDAESAAALLAQLSPAEAATIRQAIRGLGAIDPEEQSDVAAEFRRSRPPASDAQRRGVELRLSTPVAESDSAPGMGSTAAGGSPMRFDFLQSAPVGVLAGHLSREHAQTVAVVLAHLAPSHAAEVLAALPKKLQADAVERLTLLGETDSQSVAVLESELAALVAQRGSRAERTRGRDTMAAILAAAGPSARHVIVENLKTRTLATALAAAIAEPAAPSVPPRVARHQRAAPSPPALPHLDFDHLVHFDDYALAAVLREVDAGALALALAGSRDELVKRICDQMPKRTARAFQRELRRLGPTRLSDVETAQRLVAEVAARHLAQRRASRTARVG